MGGRSFWGSFVDEERLDGKCTFSTQSISSPPIVQVRQRDCIAFEIEIPLP